MTESDHTKFCTNCKTTKPTSQFYKRGKGYRSHCIACFSEKYKQRSASRNPTIPESKKCSSCGALKKSSDFHKHSNAIDGLASICKKCKRAYDKENKIRFKERRNNAPSSTKEYRQKWNAENCDLKRSYTANRRARIKNATPCFADMEAIREFYLNCPDGYEVDHIVPITSDVVCGLHVHWNMQYLTRIDNIKKGNRFEI